MNLALFNCRSICNKTTGVLQLLSDFDTDICCVTETWLKRDDHAKFAEMKDLGYSIHSQPRAGRGGGVAILYRNGIKVTGQSSKKLKTFESTECTYKSTTGEILRVVCIRVVATTPEKTHNQKFLTFETIFNRFFVQF